MPALVNPSRILPSNPAMSKAHGISHFDHAAAFAATPRVMPTKMQLKDSGTRRSPMLASLSPYGTTCRVAPAKKLRPNPPKSARLRPMSTMRMPAAIPRLLSRIAPARPQSSPAVSPCKRPKTAVVFSAEVGAEADNDGDSTEELKKFAKIEARGWKVDTAAIIGEGTFGAVQLCTQVSTGRRRVCKVVRLPTSHDREDFHRETAMHQRCGQHKNICSIIDVAEDVRFGYIVMQSCTGGELFDRIAERNFDEREAAVAVVDVLSALNFLHSKRIVHRDVKPENLLYEHERAGAPLKLIDFGFAVQLEMGQRATEMCGTSAYIAPEVLRGDYSVECDVWSLGVITYVMLSGRLPFNGRTDEEKEARILRHTGSVFFSEARGWGSISEEAKDFIRKLLLPEERERMTGRQALQHPWILQQQQKQLCTAPASVEPQIVLHGNVAGVPMLPASPRMSPRRSPMPRTLAPLSFTPRPLLMPAH